MLNVPKFQQQYTNWWLLVFLLSNMLPCGLQPKSDTGLEQAVAAPSTSQFFYHAQFSGHFSPRPAETTISASAMVTFPEDFSTDSYFYTKV